MRELAGLPLSSLQERRHCRDLEGGQRQRGFMTRSRGGEKGCQEGRKGAALSNLAHEK